MFRRYEKIHRIGKDEVDGILDGLCYIQEKVDGANASIWLEDDGTVHKGSRSQDVTVHPAWTGFCQHVDKNEPINKFFTDTGTKYVLYGEWLVRHTISYKELAYQNFYLFDIFDTMNGTYLDIEVVYALASMYGINIVPLREKLEKPTMEQLNKWVGMTDFGDRGEGIVVKNMAFKNKFGELAYGKIVSESFKEDNGITFGGNNRHSETYWEIYIMNKYCTLERVQKIIHKAESMVDGKLDMKHIPMIMSMVYHDILSEEIWEIQKKVPEITFKNLQRCISKKVKQIYIELLTGDISVAHSHGKDKIPNVDELHELQPSVGEAI